EPPAPAPPAEAPRPEGPEPARPAALPEGARRLRFAAERIARNMQASLEIPTATSFRIIPAKLLEENRRVINRFLAARRGGKVSFTHLIGWAVVRALDAVPVMRSRFVEVEGEPYVVREDRVNLGLAVDVERSDGTRTLLVPNIKGANEMDFARFWAAYEEVIRKVRENRLSPDDFAGTTVTLTNPGTIGTQLSVPRLMPGQGLIVAIGRIDYPSEYQGTDPETLARLGVGKVLGVTSTYDHRVIQGAESGLFLAKLEELLLGGDRFYDEVFAALGIPYEPVRWSADRGVLETEEGYREKQAAVIRLVNMYRVRGHLIADLNPLGPDRVLTHPELDPAFHGLTVWDLDREFHVDDLPGDRPRRTLREILDLLRDSYCRTVGVEYMHIQEPDQKRWIQERVEGVERRLSPEDKRFILERLNAAEGFERFLHTKYVGHRRYSLEGAESLIPMLDFLLEEAAASGVEHVVMGMAHRGRLNVLVNVVGKSYSRVFREFEGDIDPESVQGSGDVKYHLGASGKYTTRDGKTIAVELASNPSHLEAVDPVVEGMARATQDVHYGQDRSKVLPLLLHGDAAFAGQGVVAETFGMSALPGFTTGGTVHIVVNNQLGFTTAPSAGRSSVYPTDIAKMVQAPIFHVNADDPEACVWVARLALAFRQRFRKDVVVDLVCYRRYGHQEADDPSYTQPLMYQRIERHRSVRKLYMEQLVNRGDITVEEAEAALEDYRRRLEQAFEETRQTRSPAPPRLERRRPSGVLPPVETGVPRETLERVVRAVTSWPPDFTPHPKLARQLERRRRALEEDAVDWAMAEHLAFGSLVLEGIPVRLSGQDSRRGTFSQRHAVFVDHRTERKYYPLAHLAEDQAPFLIYDSPLNEFATLAFEYGFSVVQKHALVLWEAQFGDFANEAQVVIDNFIVSAEEKWGQTSGLVLLLPHGLEGQGPEHSSGRIERFLELCANDNIQVVVPSTPAQYFHVLRRQMHREIRKPLVLFTPKWLLRLPVARSRVEEFERGHFREVLDDPSSPDPAGVRSAVLCSGKIFYQLDERREREGVGRDLPLIRLEQLYPFPGEQVMERLRAYPNLRRVRWVQEEPENMGAYSFVHRHLHRLLPEGVAFDHVSRPESSSPATGSATLHELEQRELLRAAFEGL
ncbi:MAG TPA: multifunctional oxoglutarate decarboxylase/oxoglutarate dehydrogenase thiamine pyrophosphate-binding subunit/dihydrolipoyllysine-residue succinyltransferase subunit, partial [Actinomycetota bacterium]|nr:multifunctional oxoglutarate decarboxylase/oxoglutarate dehydrogenase thiamine pyrophosphate-binding subunit/dihydrolipoyllysine-residue succinyltransferase subunit [Actinomycetota bacterium]